MAILNHDFIETNADTFMLTIPFLLKNSYHFYYGHKTADDLFFDSYLLSLCIFVALTNEFHKVRFVKLFQFITGHVRFLMIIEATMAIGSSRYRAYGSFYHAIITASIMSGLIRPTTASRLVGLIDHSKPWTFGGDLSG